MPHLVEMQDKLGKEGFVVITVAVDDVMEENTTPEKVRGAVTEFMKATKTERLINMHLDKVDIDELDRRFRFTLLPAVYIFDRKGKWVMESPPENVDALVRKFLDEK